jgi:Na+/H+ antiporter NhaC
MRRAWIALVLAALAFALVRFAPEIDTARLAALDAHTLVGLKVGPEPAPGARDERPALADLVLDGPAVDRLGEGRARLALFGVRLVALDPTSDDPTVHDLARRSLVRGLRERSAARGLSLDVDGEWIATPLGRDRGASFLITLEGRRLALEYTHPDGTREAVERGDFAPARANSLLPPLVAIGLAVLLRRPVLALFAGIVTAAFLLRARAGAGALEAALGSVPELAGRMLWPVIADATNLQIVGFTVAMLGMVGVMSKSGGIRGTVDLVLKLASGAKSAAIATYLVGWLVYFDDYASCILTGSTLRPATDRFRISREKLAYLVDSTAAPIASVAVFTSWIAFQVSTYAPQLPAARMSAAEGFAVFVETLPFRFYCAFTLFVAALVAFTGRDLGPMLAAERRARATGKLLRDGARPMAGRDLERLEPASWIEPRARAAVVPVLVFMLVTAFEIVRVGFARAHAADPGVELSALLASGRGLTELLAEGDSVRAMLVGACAGLATAAAFALAAGLGRETARSAWSALVSTRASIAILYCAWMIGAAGARLGTAEYLTEAVGDALAPLNLPWILFLLACAVSFAIGTSWGTMSILLPLVVGLAYGMGERTPLGGHALMVMSIAAVMEGAVFGDHASPLSSTSILSSMSTASDLIDHVRTQLPYALLALGAATVLGYFPCTHLGWSPWLALAAGAAALLLILRVFGRKADASPDSAGR